MAYVTSARTGGAVILADHAGSHGKHKEDATMAARFEGITPAARKAKKPGTNTTKGTTTEGGLFKHRRRMRWARKSAR